MSAVLLLLLSGPVGLAALVAALVLARLRPASVTWLLGTAVLLTALLLAVDPWPGRGSQSAAAQLLVTLAVAAAVGSRADDRGAAQDAPPAGS